MSRTYASGGNLIPGWWQDTLRARRRVRVWARAGAAWALVLGMAWAGWAGLSPARGAEVAREAGAVAASLERKGADLKAARADLVALQKRLDVTNELCAHPDWAALLDVLTQTRPGTVAFERVEVRVQRAGDGGKTRAMATVKVSGLAATQEDAARFGEALVERGVFESVSPAETRARPVPNAKPGEPGATLVSFTVSVTMSDAKEARK